MHIPLASLVVKDWIIIKLSECKTGGLECWVLRGKFVPDAGWYGIGRVCVVVLLGDMSA